MKKKIVIIFLIFLMILIVWCDKKRDNISNQENNVDNLYEGQLEVGKYTLNYGKYYGSSYENGTDNNSVKSYYEIRNDGTYTYLSDSGKEIKGTYKVSEKDLSSIGKYFKGIYGVIFDDGGMLSVPDNNTLQVVAGAMEKYLYKK